MDLFRQMGRNYFSSTELWLMQAWFFFFLVLTFSVHLQYLLRIFIIFLLMINFFQCFHAVTFKFSAFSSFPFLLRAIVLLFFSSDVLSSVFSFLSFQSVENSSFFSNGWSISHVILWVYLCVFVCVKEGEQRRYCVVASKNQNWRRQESRGSKRLSYWTWRGMRPTWGWTSHWED